MISLNLGCFLSTSISQIDANTSNQLNPAPSETAPSIDQEKIQDIVPNLLHENVSLLNPPLNIDTNFAISPDKNIGLRLTDSHGGHTNANGTIDSDLYIVYLDGSKKLDKIKFPFQLNSQKTIKDIKFTSDSKSIVFRSNQLSTTWGLYKINIDSTGFVCLSCPMLTGSEITSTQDFQITGVPEKVIFYANIDNLSIKELYSNNLEGTALTKLNTPLTGTGVISSYSISSDGNYVVYSGNHTLSSPKHIYVVSTNGTGLLKLNSDGIAGNNGAFYPKFSPDNLRIVFTHDRTVIGQHELFIVDRNGANEIQISPNIKYGILESDFSKDGTRYIFRSHHEVNGKFELYSAATNGTGTVKLNVPLDNNTDVYLAGFSPLGDKVIYTSDDIVGDLWSMYSINVDGSNRVLLHANMKQENSATQKFDPQVLFLNNTTFVYIADAGYNNTFELYRINLDGSGGSQIYTPTSGLLLAGLKVGNAGSQLSISKNELSLMLSIPSSGNFCALAALNLTTLASNNIYDCNVNNSSYYSFSERVDNNSLLVMTHDQMFQLGFDGNYKQELFYRNNELSSGFKIAPDSNTIFSLGRHYDNSLTFNTLENTNINTGISQTVVSDINNYISEFFFAPSSTIVHFFGFPGPKTSYFDLYKVNYDGSGLLKLNGATQYNLFSYDVGGFGYFPGTNRLAIYAEQGMTFKKEIFGMDYDGSNYGKLHPNIVDDAEQFRISPTGDKILYATEQDVNNINEIYSSNLDGTGNVKLNAPLPSGGDVDYYQFEILPNGQKALFLAEQDIDNVSELFSVNMDGTSRVKLHPNLSVGQYVSDFWFTNDNQKIIFIGKVSSSSEVEMFSVNTDGTSFQKISGPMISNGSIYSNYYENNRFKISNNSQKVVFLAKKEDLTKSELYSVNLDGSNLVKISPTLSFSEASITEFSISDDSTKVIFKSNFENKDKEHLYSVDITGGNIKRLSRNFNIGDYITGHTVVDNKIIYRLVRDDKAELYKIHQDGTNHIRFHDDLLKNQNVGINYEISADKSKIIFHLNKSNYIKSNLYWAPL